MRILAVYLCLAFSCAAAALKPGQEARLDISAAPIPHGCRIVGVDFKVSDAVISLPRAPGGWTVSISNEVNGEAELKGEYLVGAASLSVAEFEGMLTIQVLDGRYFSAHLKLVLMRLGSGEEIDFPVAEKDVRFIPVHKA
jgi:hypothetical protein